MVVAYENKFKQRKESRARVGERRKVKGLTFISSWNMATLGQKHQLVPTTFKDNLK